MEKTVLSVSSRGSSATLSRLSKPLFVTFTGAPARTFQSAQALVLIGLNDDRFAPPATLPLVSISMKSEEEPVSVVDTKGSLKRVMHFDMGKDPRTIRQGLLPHDTYMPDPVVFKQQSVLLEEAYLHSTLANWEGKTKLEKALIVGSSFYRHQAITFSLRFSHKKGGALDSNLATAFRRLRNLLTPVTALGPTMMVVERDKQGRPHIHGIVMTTADRPTVRKALGPIGGKSGNPAFNLHKLKLKDASNSVCWAAYMTKDLLERPDSDASDLIYMSQSAIRAGKAHLGELKEFSKRKLDVVPDWRGRAAIYSKTSTPAITVMSASTSGMTRH